MQLEGSIQLLQNRAKQLKLQANSLHKKGFQAALQLELLASNTISINGQATEPAGGYFGELLQLPEQQAIDAQLIAKLVAEQNAYHIALEKLSAPVAQHLVAAEGRIASNLDFSAGEIDSLTLLTDTQAHHFKAKWSPENINARAKIHQLPIAISAPWQQYLKGGHISADLTLTGNYQTPLIHGDLSLASEYLDQDLALSANANSTGQMLNIAELTGSWGESTLGAEGTVSWQQASDLSLRIANFNLLELEQFGLTLPSELSAHLAQAELQLQGPLQNIEGLEGQGKISVNGEYAKQKFALHSQLKKTGNTLHIQRSHLEMENTGAELQGTLDINTLHSNLKLSTQLLPLALVQLAGAQLPEQLQGNAQITGAVTGDLRQPHIGGQAIIDGRYKNLPFQLHTEGDFNEQNLQLKQFELISADQPVLQLSGKLNPETLDITLSAGRLPTEILEAFGWSIQAGELTANFDVQGPLRSPDINGQLSYYQSPLPLESREHHAQVHFGLQFGISTQNSQYDLVAQLIDGDLPSAQIEVTIPQHLYSHFFASKSLENKRLDSLTDIPLNAAIRSQLNLFSLSHFVDPDIHRINGMLQSRIQLQGTLGKPELQGELKLASGSYQNPINGTQVNNAECVIQIKQAKFTLANCQAEDGNQGQMQLSGHFRLPERTLHFAHLLEQQDVQNPPWAADSGEIALGAALRKAQLIRRPDIESQTNGKLLVEGNFESVLAHGKLEVTPLTALIDAASSSNIPKIKVTRVESLEQQPETTAQQTNPWLPTIKLDLVVSAGQQAYIRGHGIEAELSGKITLRGSVEKPRYDGEFKTLRGMFEVFGKKFQLEEGQVNFSNDAIALNITGVYNRQNQLIRAQLTGTGEAPRLNLSAEPSMAEDEILAFIIFGKSVRDITPFQALQLASSAQTLRGGGSFFDPIGSARDLLGVDTLTIDTETDEEGDTGVNVGVGKYLNDKVYLELERSPNPSQPWKGNIQIELTPNVHLESVTGETSGIDGAEIKWRKDY